MTEWRQDATGKIIEDFFKEFLETYGKTGNEPSIYMKQLEDKIIQESNIVTLVIEPSHMWNAPKIQNLAELILTHLPLYMPSLQNGANKVLKDLVNSETKFFVTIEFTVPEDIVILGNLQAEGIGKYVKIQGTVVKTFQSAPELVRGTFVCQGCNTKYPDVIQHYGFTTPYCPTCNAEFDLIQGESIFMNHQRIRIQDDSLGSAHMMDCIIRNDHCGKLKPGDPVSLHGCTIAVPRKKLQKKIPKVAKEVQAGFAIGEQPPQNQQIREQRRARDDQPTFTQEKTKIPQAIEFSMCFLVNGFAINVKDIAPSAEQEVIDRMCGHPDAIVQSFAPFVYGLQDLKTSIVLQLIGGVDKRTSDQLTIRSDVNILLVGDPAVAKSSLLKYTAKFSERGVYTSGKSASAAGLTAAIVQDEDGEWGVEAGAVLRANGGICCIDEFEKITASDQSALHEVMEQQSVSLSKAGVQATLKARTPVLAAMNPINCKYDAMRSLRQNINIGAALLSRFDLVFVVQDIADEKVDSLIARTIIKGASGVKKAVTFTEEELRIYITAAKKLQPTLSREAQESIRNIWVELRQRDLQMVGQKNFRMTVRQLESLTRLSEAYAKLEFKNEVTPEHVTRASRLLEKTQVQVQAETEVIVLGQSEEENDLEDDLEASGAEQRIVEVTLQEMRKLTVIMSYALKQTGETGFTEETFIEMAKINLQLDVILTDEEMTQVAKVVFKKLREEKNWINDGVLPGMYIFTHLAPEV